MRLYCLDIIAIAFVTFVSGGIVVNKVNEKPVDKQEIEILKQGYKKTDLTEKQLYYSNYQECVEYKNKFYCY